MWVVADLNDVYIGKMKDLLETHEQPYDRQEPVVCLDEKPVTLHPDIRSPSPAAPGGKRGAIINTTLRYRQISALVEL